MTTARCLLSRVRLHPPHQEGYSLARIQNLRFSSNIPGNISIVPEKSTNKVDKDKNKSLPKFRLDVAIVGLPNAGKSQLLNSLTRAPISAVSKKRHTTVKGVLGVRTVLSKTDATQLVFVDTPGFLRRDDVVDRDLMETPLPAEAEYVDHTLLVVDAARSLTDSVKQSLAQLITIALEARGREPFLDMDELVGSDDEDDDVEVDNGDGQDDDDDDTGRNDEDELIEFMSQPKFSVVLNKVDLVTPKRLLLDTAVEIGAVAGECIRRRLDELIANTSMVEKPVIPKQVVESIMPTFFYTAAIENDDRGVEDLFGFLLTLTTPCESFEVDPGETTTLSPEERVEEIIREKLYRCLHQEVPYQIRQNNRLFRVVEAADAGKPVVVVHQDLLVRTNSHRDLVLGKNRKRLQMIENMAVKDLEKIFGCRVDLFLHVKLVKSNHGV